MFPVALIKQVIVFPEHNEPRVKVVGPGRRETPELRLPNEGSLEFSLGLAADGQVMHPEIVTVVGIAVNKQDLVVAEPVDDMDVPC
ncbi:hypothetical protein V6N13_149600 [Hibiscus sabdariffa]|uniref:Uncharacterized protein n=1 Tax=Hibiscus sabdariffa TaxID=183260 RepID=A0ABR2EHC2_9ROSI